MDDMDEVVEVGGLGQGIHKGKVPQLAVDDQEPARTTNS